jgi:HEAT repeat protein
MNFVERGLFFPENTIEYPENVAVPQLPTHIDTLQDSQSGTSLLPGYLNTHQDYDTAKRTSKLSAKDQYAFVQTHRYNPQFFLTIRLLASCIWENRDLEKMELFFEWLYSEHVDLIGSYQIKLVLACLDECRCDQLEELIWQRYGIAIFVGDVLKSETTRDCLIPLMAISQRVFDQIKKAVQPGNDRQLFNWFCNHLRQCVRREYLSDLNWLFDALEDDSITICAFRTVAAHAGEESLNAMWRWCQSALSHPHPGRRQTALEIIGAIVDNVNTLSLPEILKGIEPSLNHDNAHVRAAAFLVLGKIAANIDTSFGHNILHKIKPALSDRSEYVRAAAITALGEVATRANEKLLCKIFNHFRTALGDPEKRVQQAAMEALEQMTSRANKPVLDTLLDQLRRGLGKGGSSGEISAKILVKITEYAEENDIPVILRWFLMALSDPYCYFEGTIEAFVGMAAHTDKKSTLTILEWLQMAKTDKRLSVRKAVIKAFGELATNVEEESIPIILQEIQAALQDENPEIHEMAMESFKKVALYADAESIFKMFSFQTFLSHNNWELRKYALEVLGQVAVHAKEGYCPQLLDIVESALHDEHWYVRFAAANILEQLAPRITEKSLDLLLSRIRLALADKTSDVRKTALHALLSLNTKLLLSVFISSSEDLSFFKPYIFEHFLSQCTPLYLIENTIRAGERAICPFEMDEEERVVQLCHNRGKEKPQETCTIS